MFLTFKVRLRTENGQSLWLTGDHKIFGNGDAAKALPMERLDEELWQATLEFHDGRMPDAVITYNYLLREADGMLIYDWGKDKRVNPARLAAGETLILSRKARNNRSRRGNEPEQDQDSASLPPRPHLEEVVMVDPWNSAGRIENVFSTEPFVDVLLRSDGESGDQEVEHKDESRRMEQPIRATHAFRVKAPLLPQGQIICLLGGCSALGNWNITAPILLEKRAGEDSFSVELDLRNQALPIEYKYGVFDLREKKFLQY